MTPKGAVEARTPASRTGSTGSITATPVTPHSETPHTTVSLMDMPPAVTPRQGQRKEKEGQTGLVHHPVTSSLSSPISVSAGPTKSAPICAPPAVDFAKKESLMSGIQPARSSTIDKLVEPKKIQERVSYQNMIVRYGDWSHLRIQVVAYFLIMIMVYIYRGHSEEIVRMTAIERVSTGRHIHCDCDPTIEQLNLRNIREQFRMEKETDTLHSFLLIMMGVTSPLWERFVGRRKILYVMLGAAIPAAVILMFNHHSFTQQLSHLILTLTGKVILILTVCTLAEMLPYELRYLAAYSYIFATSLMTGVATMHFRFGFDIFYLGMCSAIGNLVGIFILRFVAKDSICHLNIRNDVNAIQERLHKEELRIYNKKKEHSTRYHEAVAKRIFEDIVYLDQEELQLSEFLKRLYKSFTMIEIFLIFFQAMSTGMHQFETERFTNARFYAPTELAEDRTIGLAVAGVLMFFLRKAHRNRVICWLFAATLLNSAFRHTVIQFDWTNLCANTHFVQEKFNGLSILLSVFANALYICIQMTIALHFLETAPSILRPTCILLVFLPLRIFVQLAKDLYKMGDLKSQESSGLSAIVPAYTFHIVIILVTMLRTRSKLPFSLYLFELMPQSENENATSLISKKTRSMENTLPAATTVKEKPEIKDQKTEENQSISQGISGKEEPK